MRVNDLYPTQSPEVVREAVTVAHFSLDRLKQLVDAQPSLANAAWDWGFGDWETPLGAASHMGNRPIAEYLLSKGARASIFSAAMLGQFEVVKAFVAAQPHVESISGPHSISLLAHAKAGGEQAFDVFKYLQLLGDADAVPQHAIDDSQASVLTGSYSFGFASNERIEVGFEHGHITWTRIGTMTHTLFHLGGLSFYPAGAAHARITFKPEQNDVTMTVNDPGPVLVAQKSINR